MIEQPENTSLDLADYLRVARNKWPSIVTITLVSAAAALIWSVRQPKVYQSTCSVIIDPSAPQVLAGVKDVVELGTGSYWSSRDFYETQYKIIRSHEAILQVVDSLGLASAGEVRGKKGSSREDISKAILANTTVQPVKDSRIANISVTSTDPAKAARIANAIATVYIERNLDHKVESSRLATAWLGDQTVTITETLKRAEHRLYDFRKKNQLLESDLEIKLGMTNKNLETYNLKLADLRAQRLQLESTRKVVQRLAGGPSEKVTLPIVRDNPIIERLRVAFFDLSKARAELESRYGDKHPRVSALQSQIDKVDQDYRKEVDNILAALETSYETIVENEKALARLMDAERKSAIELAELDVEYRPLAREAQTNAKLYDLITQREKETALTGLIRTNNIRVLDAAAVATSPIKPRPVVNVTLGAFVGLVMGLVFALATELLDRTLRNQEQVEAVTGLPVLGLVPVIGGREKKKLNEKELRERDLQVFHDPKSTVAEACRSIRTNILFMSPDRPIQMFIITSPGPQEGKTTTAISLAITLAQPGKKVLLVDTDLRRPRIHRSFGIPNTLGVSSCIVGDSTLEASIVKTDVENLSVLPSGPIPPNPAELLHTMKFRRLTEECRSKFDFVIFDTPPISAVTDPAIISHLTDGVVLVARAGQTTKDALGFARRQLADAKANILGTIVNRVDLRKRGYAYHYARYYRAYGAGGYNSNEEPAGT